MLKEKPYANCIKLIFFMYLDLIQLNVDFLFISEYFITSNTN